jgi:hypothetical protein
MLCSHLSQKSIAFSSTSQSWHTTAEHLAHVWKSSDIPSHTLQAFCAAALSAGEDDEAVGTAAEIPTALDAVETAGTAAELSLPSSALFLFFSLSTNFSELASCGGCLSAMAKSLVWCGQEEEKDVRCCV